jgi:molybdopterin synthase catalytic subunit
VRDHHEGRVVHRLDYEAYEPMAEKEFEAILVRLQTGNPQARCFVAHRLGELAVGDVAIVCAVSTPHRAEAFALCRELIDSIKASVPIWKREWGPDGSSWVGWEDARCGAEHGHNHDAQTSYAHDDAKSSK